MRDDEFTDLFRRHAGAMLRHATRLCGDRAQAEDAVGEAFARMYARFPHATIHSPRAYLRRAVVNEVHDAHRHHFRARGLLARPTPDLIQEGHAELLAERGRVTRLLADLPRRQRVVLMLRFHADLSEARVAEVMGCPLGTVKSLTSRGLGRLRAALEYEEGALADGHAAASRNQP